MRLIVLLLITFNKIWILLHSIEIILCNRPMIWLNNSLIVNRSMIVVKLIFLIYKIINRLFLYLDLWSHWPILVLFRFSELFCLRQFRIFYVKLCLLMCRISPLFFFKLSLPLLLLILKNKILILQSVNLIHLGWKSFLDLPEVIFF